MNRLNRHRAELEAFWRSVMGRGIPDADRGWKRTAVLFWAFVLSYVLFSFAGFGVSCDEPVQNAYGGMILRYWKTLGRDGNAVTFSDLWLYGGFFEVMAAKLTGYLDPHGWQARHLFNAAYGLLAVLFLFKAGRRHGGWPAAVFGAASLFFTAYWTGHGFNNPKDIPFAVGYAGVSYYLLKIIDQSPKPRWPDVIKLGVVLGATLGVRLGGAIVLVFMGAVAIGVVIHRAVMDARDLKAWARLLAQGFTVVLLGWALMVLPWPYLLEDPLRRPFTTLGIIKNFVHEQPVLFLGKVWDNRHLPMSYVTVGLGVRLPLVVLAAFLSLPFVAVLSCARKWIGIRKALSFCLVAFALFAPWIAWTLHPPPLYDGVRHALFLFPLIAAMAGLGFSGTWSLLNRLPRLQKSLGVLVFACFAVLGVEMLYMQPHLTSSFNLLTGATRGAYGRFELDEWGAGWTQARDEMVQKLSRDEPGWRERGVRITVIGPGNVFGTQMPPGIQVVGEDLMGKGDFMIQSLFPGHPAEGRIRGDVWLQISRMGRPLVTITRIPP